MKTRVQDFANDAFAFIEAIEKVDSPDALLCEMERTLGAFGFENFVITDLPRPGEPMRRAILIHRLPDKWIDLYTRRDYATYDPVIRHCRNTVNPFEWSEAPVDADREPMAAEVMSRARDFRMEQGFCLPIHGIGGVEACISLSGKSVDLTPRTKPAIHLMALYAFERGRKLSRTGRRSCAISLSPRELEVLEWSARGLSAGAIAGRLGITERTVTAHVVNACQKMGAANKVQAVAQAVHFRLITP